MKDLRSTTSSNLSKLLTKESQFISIVLNRVIVLVVANFFIHTFKLLTNDRLSQILHFAFYRATPEDDEW